MSLLVLKFQFCKIVKCKHGRLQTGAHKNGGFFQYSTMGFTKTEQCERTKTDVFRCVFVIGQITVNAQKRRFFSPFLYRNGAVLRGSFDATKTDTNKNGAV